MPKSTMPRVKAERHALQFEQIDALVEDTNRLLESVYSMVNSPRRQSPPMLSPCSRTCLEHSPKRTNFNSEELQSPKSPCPSSTARSMTVIASSPSSLEIEREIHRISRFCQALEHNLDTVNWQNSPNTDGASARRSPTMTSSSSSTMVTSNSPVVSTANMVTTPRGDCRMNAFIDLSNEDYVPLPLIRKIPANDYDNDDDEVICITPSAGSDSIVDLCTPTQPRRRRVSRNGRGTSRSAPLESNRRNSNAARCPQSNSNVRAAVSSDGSSSSRSRSPTAAHSSVSRCSVQTSTTNILDASLDEAKGSSSSSASLSERTPFMCAVCMESCVNNQPTSTKCGHVFCEQCIREAVRLTRKCPMCNTKLTSRMLLRIYV